MDAIAALPSLHSTNTFMHLQPRYLLSRKDHYLLSQPTSKVTVTFTSTSTTSCSASTPSKELLNFGPAHKSAFIQFPSLSVEFQLFASFIAFNVSHEPSCQTIPRKLVAEHCSDVNELWTDRRSIFTDILQLFRAPTSVCCVFSVCQLSKYTCFLKHSLFCRRSVSRCLTNVCCPCYCKYILTAECLPRVSKAPSSD